MNLGRLVEAEADFREALRLRRQLLGPEHPFTANTLHELGVVRRRLGDHVGAEAALQDALRIRRRLYGDANEDVRATASELVLLYQAQGRSAAADSLRLLARRF